MIHTTCTSTDPTSHQGDTCPIHEQHDALIGDVVNRECDRPAEEGACDSTKATVYEVNDVVVYQCNLCEILSSD